MKRVVIKSEVQFILALSSGICCYERLITFFIFDTAREAQRFLNFERCELQEDEILGSEILEESNG